MLSRIVCLLLLLVCGLKPYAQNLVTVKLDAYGRDDRFERFNLNMALFDLPGDTMLTWDYEGLTEARQRQVKKPNGFSAYAYGFLFFAAHQNTDNPGYLPVLVGNPYHKNPTLFADLNGNYDFTDDAFERELPWRGDSTVIDFCIPGTDVCSRVKFSRHTVDGKFAYKELMNEFYAVNYPNRKFIGMEHCYREQHYQTKYGVLNIGGEACLVGLYDGNNDGIYNEADSDRFVMANLSDTVFYPFDELYSSLISHKAGKCFVDKNGKQFEWVSASPDGSSLQLRVLDQTNNANQIKVGKKLPRFKYITWKGERNKIAKLRRYELFIYFGSPQSPGFKEDTAALRILAHKYADRLKVIGFIEVNKSYELSIFGQYSYLNWILAFKDKELNKNLGIRGLPSSIYTKKRRKVVAYNLSPKALLEQLEKAPVGR